MDWKGLSASVKKTYPTYSNVISTALYFDFPFNRVVAYTKYQSFDIASIRLWNLESGKCEHEYKDTAITTGVRIRRIHFVKWGESTFSFSHRNVIETHSILKPYEKIARIEISQTSHHSFKFLKLSDSVIATLQPKGVVIYECPSGREIAKSKELKVHSNFGKIILSKKFNNRFFINSNDYSFRYRLVQFQYDSKNGLSILNEFSEHFVITYDISSYINKIHEEILVCGGQQKKIFFINTDQWKMVRIVEFRFPIRKLLIINRNDYLLVSGDNFQILDLNPENESENEIVPVILRKEYTLASHLISIHRIIEEISCTNNSAIVLGYGKKGIYEIEINNLPMSYKDNGQCNRQSKLDLSERIEFLFKNIDEHVFYSSKNHFLLSIFIFGDLLVKLSKIFLL